jgi:hypothetical protein
LSCVLGEVEWGALEGRGGRGRVFVFMGVAGT